MTLDGSAAREGKPVEDTSGGRAVACASAGGICSAALPFPGEPGWYTPRVQSFDQSNFDQSNGVTHFRLSVGKQLIDGWAADLRLPRAQEASIPPPRRRAARLRGVALRPGDEIRIEGRPDGGELAALDDLEVVRER